MQTYIKNVHNSGFSTDLMQAVGLWLTSVARRTAEWPPDLFNPSPLFLLACTLVENNKAQSRDLLGYTETLLRAALNCCNVSTESLVRLIQVTSLLYRRAAAAKPVGSDALPSNPIVHAMLEVIAESVRLKARTTPATLTSLFEAMTATAVGELFQGYNANHGVAFNLASDALLFLYNDSAPGSLIQSSFDVSQAAATLVVEVANHLPAVLARLKQQPATLRLWNMLVLAALHNGRNRSAAVVFEYFSIFSLAYSHALGAYQRPQQLLDPQDSAHIEISSVYVAIKLWLLLVRKAALQYKELRHNEQNQLDVLQDGEVMATKMVWNELWPPYGRIMSILEADARVGNISPMASSMWSSVADLLLFLRQARITALNVSSEANTISRLRAIVQGEAKLTRVMRSLTEPQADVPLEYFVSQINTEMRAEEKLHAAKRYDSLPEKGRRLVS